MAYAVPKQWAHGDQPAAADMQKYSDSLAYLKTLCGDTAHNWAIPYSLYADTQDFWLVHSRRYLVYVSAGRIVDPALIGEDVSLSAETTFGSHDLDSISWMYYGKLYRVIGCSVCTEDGIGT
jgi:hypothetical protein